MFDEPVVFPTEGHYDTAALYFAREKTNVKALGELLILFDYDRALFLRIIENIFQEI